MNPRLAQIADIRQRLRQGQPLDSQHVELLAPALDSLEVDMVHIEFRPVGQAFMVDGQKMPRLRGFQFIHKLLAKPGVPIACTDLEGVATEARQEIVDKRTVRDMIRAVARHKDDIEQIAKARPHASPDDEMDRIELLEARRTMLRECEAELGKVTFRGRSRVFSHAGELCRKRVRRNIQTALKRLSPSPIGDHLSEHIVTGNSCRYTGGWSWKTQKNFFEKL